MKTISDATCLACGCLCDDIRLGVEQNQIVAAEHACPIGEQWFLAKRPDEAVRCMVDGKAVELQAAIERAAELLAGARRVLVFGLAGATCEAQRAAISIAERVGGIVAAGDAESAQFASAVTEVGMVTASLGEVRHRADLVVFWRADPANTHQRHFERYSLTCAGEFVPGGRGDRFVAAVDERRTRTADSADLFLQVRPGGSKAAAETVRSILNKEYALDEADVSLQTGLELSAWRDMAERMKSARYAAVFFDPAVISQALLPLVRDLNRHTRCVALPLGKPSNAAGAGQVLAWQTGCSVAADFAAGHPQCEQSLTAERLLSDKLTDAALIVACDPIANPLVDLSASAREHLVSKPVIALHTTDWPQMLITTPSVAIPVATPGIHAAGTAFRSDGVALPLRPAVLSVDPPAERILAALEEKVQQTLSAAATS